MARGKKSKKEEPKSWVPAVAGLAVAVTIVGGVAYASRVADSAENFTYEIVGGNSITVRNGTTEGKITFNLINRGPATIRVQRINLDITAGGFNLARVDFSPNLRIPRYSERALDVPVRVPILQTLFNAVVRIFGAGLSPKASITGAIVANGVRIEVNEPYDLTINDNANG